jgi:hypothetical protein
LLMAQLYLDRSHTKIVFNSDITVRFSIDKAGFSLYDNRRQNNSDLAPICANVHQVKSHP